METDNPFEKVLDRLRGKGWIKGYFGKDTGPNCLVGAGMEVGLWHEDNWDNHPLYKDLLRIIDAQYPTYREPVEQHQTHGMILPEVPIPRFNDHPDTTFSDVERVLEKAAVKWEEERVLRED